MRSRLLLFTLGLGLVALVLGCLLPDSSEVRRTRVLDASPAEVLARLRQLPGGPAWSAWSPSQRVGGLSETACLPERGIWFDVHSDPPRKAAILFEPQAQGLRLVWSDVSQWRGNPLGRIAAWSREGRRGEELEQSLMGLERALAGSPAQEPREPGPDSPQVLLIIADDLGWDLLAASHTPNLDALAASGMTCTNLWVTPKCGPTRASMLTGRFHFRIGNGEIAKRHKNRSMGLEEVTLPERIGSQRSAAYGKWHLGTDARHPNDTGFGHYAGSLGNLNGKSYTDWPKVVDGEESQCEHYATSDVTDEALAHDADFEWVAYHAVHTPFHDPPPELHPNTPLDGTEEVQVRAMTEAFDKEVGRLLAGHPGAWVFFLGDNGTTSLVGGGKGSMMESGINTPLFVRGPGVKAGSTSDALINGTDFFSTIAEIFDVASDAQDSISFLPVLKGGAGEREWNYSSLFYEQRPGRRMHAIRDFEYKFVIDFEKEEYLYAMPGEVPIDLKNAGDETLARLEALRALIPRGF
jgi:arylsulfatase A-like enzyme